MCLELIIGLLVIVLFPPFHLFIVYICFSVAEVINVFIYFVNKFAFKIVCFILLTQLIQIFLEKFTVLLQEFIVDDSNMGLF
jgi:hypothetical protein